MPIATHDFTGMAVDIPAEVWNAVVAEPIQPDISFTSSFSFDRQVIKVRSLETRQSSSAVWRRLVVEDPEKFPWIALAVETLDIVDFVFTFNRAATVYPHPNSIHGRAGYKGRDGKDGQGVGAHGEHGESGESGQDGRTATMPAVYVFVKELIVDGNLNPSGAVSSAMHFSFDAFPGGNGGNGGMGGRGGNGSQGSGAVGGGLWCNKGAGPGGNGGNGGVGAARGIGANGSDASNIYVIFDDDSDQIEFANFSALGGARGLHGDNAQSGGKGGKGGPEGGWAAGCSSPGRNGHDGVDGGVCGIDIELLPTPYEGTDGEVIFQSGPDWSQIFP